MLSARIETNPAVLVGKPVIRGTRLAVEFLLDLMAEGWTMDQILENSPQLTAEDLSAILECAGDRLAGPGMIQGNR